MTTAAFQDLIETFEFLDDWEDRYRHVIEMGKAMPPLEPALQVDATRVEGCASQVWLHPEIDGQGPDAVLHFRGDSDAIIVKGLIAVLHALYDGVPVGQVGDVDAVAALGELGLTEHLSAQRSNGVRAMIERIRSVSAQAAQG